MPVNDCRAAHSCRFETIKPLQIAKVDYEGHRAARENSGANKCIDLLTQSIGVIRPTNPAFSVVKTYKPHQEPGRIAFRMASRLTCPPRLPRS